ncbi:hypothetical protein JCM30566_03200 [Marinitoga arctica]
MLLPYEDYIINTDFSKGLLFIFENISNKNESIYMDISISEKPSEVPKNIYRLLKLSKKTHLLKLGKINFVNKSFEQKVLLRHKDKMLILNYSLLKRTERSLIKYIIKKINTETSNEILDLMLKGSNLAYIFLDSKRFLEEASKNTTDINKLIYIFLTIITIETGGSFNRAIFFHKNGVKYEILRAFGFKNTNEAYAVWTMMGKENYDFEYMIDIYTKKDFFSSLEEEIKGYEITEEEIKNINDILNKGKTTLLSESRFPRKLKEFLDIKGECAICTLKNEGKIFGFIIADNRYTLNPITSDQLYALEYFSKLVSVFWENKLYIESLKINAEKDFLTGLFNRMSLEKYIEYLQLSEVTNIGIVYIDMDNFKKINDNYGHQEGDRILKIFSNILLKNIRADDKAFRIGGDEFLIILNKVTEKDLIKLMKRISMLYKENTGYSFSAGGVICNNASEINKYIKRADDLLYKAKKESKGKIKM